MCDCCVWQSHHPKRARVRDAWHGFGLYNMLNCIPFVMREIYPCVVCVLCVLVVGCVTSLRHIDEWYDMRTKRIVQQYRGYMQYRRTTTDAIKSSSSAPERPELFLYKSVRAESALLKYSTLLFLCAAVVVVNVRNWNWKSFVENKPKNRFQRPLSWGKTTLFLLLLFLYLYITT